MEGLGITLQQHPITDEIKVKVNCNFLSKEEF